MKCLLARIHNIRPELSKDNDWFLFHDNALAHTSGCVSQYMTKRKVCMRPHPYLLDLTPADFYLFPKIKHHLKGQYFNDVEENLVSSYTAIGSSKSIFLTHLNLVQVIKTLY